MVNTQMVMLEIFTIMKVKSLIGGLKMDLNGISSKMVKDTQVMQKMVTEEDILLMVNMQMEYMKVNFLKMV